MNILWLCFFIISSGTLYAQDLVFIPDQNFRNSLAEYDLLTRDSLDLMKIKKKRFSAISFANKGITNLYGLQFFEDLDQVNVSGNDLSDLNHLPKKLVNLFCSKNSITELPGVFPDSLRIMDASDNLLKRINHLPLHAENIDFSDNRIEQITCVPPASLKFLLLANNSIQTIPCHYGGIAFINFYDNPILEKELCDSFYQGKCISPNQNCRKLEYGYRTDIIRDRKNTNGEIFDSVRVVFMRQYAWPPVFVEIDTFDYINDKTVDSFRLARIGYQLRKSKSPPEFGERYDSLVSSQFSGSLIDSLVFRVREGVQSFRVQKDSINLALEVAGIPYAGIHRIGGNCADCTRYIIGVEIKRNEDQLALVHYFEGQSAVRQLFSGRMIKLEEALMWINSYMLYEEIFDINHQLRRRIYSIENLKLMAEELESRRKI